MKEQLLNIRLSELKSEYETGKKMLADLEIRQSNMKSSLLRISGAIQVLEELLNQQAIENETDEKTEAPAIRSVEGG